MRNLHRRQETEVLKQVLELTEFNPAAAGIQYTSSFLTHPPTLGINICGLASSGQGLMCGWPVTGRFTIPLVVFSQGRLC